MKLIEVKNNRRHFEIIRTRNHGLWGPFILLFLFWSVWIHAADRLPFTTVFQGKIEFNRLAQRAENENWSALPIGERTVTIGRALVGTPYQSYTLEIDDHIEAPSANLTGVDCWTFFEISLAFARMIAEPQTQWTPQNFLYYIELDRYRGGHCTGNYLSRLHYLEDWALDNERRGLVVNLTHELGGVRVHHQANEMTHGWKEYRYLRSNPSLIPALTHMENRVTDIPMDCIPNRKVRTAEKKIQNGDIICVVSRDFGTYVSTSHVGLALRAADGKVHFMHASSPHNFGKVVIDDELSRYLSRYSTDVGIIVIRPLK